jgi:hypothetical protein
MREVGTDLSSANIAAKLGAAAGVVRRWWLAGVAVVAAMLCVPFMHSVVAIGDEGVLLDGAERMLRGDRLYADFFEFLPPGGFILTAVWFSIAGLSFLSARLMVILTVVGIACFTFLGCRQASKNAPLSALLATGWVLVSQGVWTQVSHHWLTTMFSMVTVWAALASVEDERRGLRWPLLAGVSGGMAAMVTPTNGALAIVAAVTAFADKSRKQVQFIAYVLGCALVPVALIAYVLWNNAFSAAFDDVIRFTATRYAPIQGVPFGWGQHIQTFPLVWVFPVTGLLALLVYTRDWRTCRHDRLLLVCAASCIVGFVSSFPRPSCVHLSFTVPLACPLLALCVIRLTRLWPIAWRTALLGGLIAFLAPAALFLTTFGQMVMHEEAVATPAGEVSFPRQSVVPKMLARLASLPADDGFFFYPTMPLMPFLTGRQQASKYDVFTPGYTTQPQYRDACLSVMRDVSWVVIMRMDPALWKKNFPAMKNTEPPEAKAFELALDRSFDLVAREGSYELRHRRSDVSEAVCADGAL